MELNRTETRQIIKDRVGKVVDRKNPWLKHFNIGIFICLVMAFILVMVGFVGQVDHKEIVANSATYTLDNHDTVQASGKYLWVKGQVFAERVYQLPDGSFLKEYDGDLIDKNNNVVARVDQAEDWAEPVMEIGVVLAIVVLVIWLMVFAWWDSRRLKETDQALETYYKTGELPPDPEEK